MAASRSRFNRRTRRACARAVYRATRSQARQPAARSRRRQAARDAGRSRSRVRRMHASAFSTPRSLAVVRPRGARARYQRACREQRQPDRGRLRVSAAPRRRARAQGSVGYLHPRATVRACAAWSQQRLQIVAVGHAALGRWRRAAVVVLVQHREQRPTLVEYIARLEDGAVERARCDRVKRKEAKRLAWSKASTSSLKRCSRSERSRRAWSRRSVTSSTARRRSASTSIWRGATAGRALSRTRARRRRAHSTFASQVFVAASPASYLVVVVGIKVRQCTRSSGRAGETAAGAPATRGTRGRAGAATSSDRADSVRRA